MSGAYLPSLRLSCQSEDELSFSHSTSARPPGEGRAVLAPRFCLGADQKREPLRLQGEKCPGTCQNGHPSARGLLLFGLKIFVKLKNVPEKRKLPAFFFFFLSCSSEPLSTVWQLYVEASRICPPKGINHYLTSLIMLLSRYARASV